MGLIDATKAIKSIDEIVCSMSVCISSDYRYGMTAMKDAAMHAIEEQPTVDAVPVVHGKWILKERAHYFKCSLCKEPIAYRFGYGGDRYYKYCPRCGAKMDGADGERKDEDE